MCLLLPTQHSCRPMVGKANETDIMPTSDCLGGNHNFNININAQQYNSILMMLLVATKR